MFSQICSGCPCTPGRVQGQPGTVKSVPAHRMGWNGIIPKVSSNPSSPGIPSSPNPHFSLSVRVCGPGKSRRSLSALPAHKHCPHSQLSPRGRAATGWDFSSLGFWDLHKLRVQTRPHQSDQSNSQPELPFYPNLGDFWCCSEARGSPSLLFPPRDPNFCPEFPLPAKPNPQPSQERFPRDLQSAKKRFILDKSPFPSQLSKMRLRQSKHSLDSRLISHPHALEKDPGNKTNSRTGSSPCTPRI